MEKCTKKRYARNKMKRKKNKRIPVEFRENPE
jgi:hypothetical protein